MKFLLGGRAGAVLAVLASLMASQMVRSYYFWDESIAYNVLFWLNPIIFGYPSTDLTVEEQTAHFRKTTESMESSATESSSKFFGDAFYQASFGENKTQLMELQVPSATSEDYHIPVLCAAPAKPRDASTSTSLPLILYFFGGGLVLGSPKAELLMVRWAAQEANAIVCAVEYRLAPRFPYPTPILDAVDGSVGVLSTTYSKQISATFGVQMDLNRVGLYGVSAGGYIAGQVARHLTQRLDHKLCCQALLVPMIKPHGGTASAIKQWDNPVWGGFKNSFSWTAFLPGDDGTLAADWKVNLLADPPQEVWSQLPPAYIQIHSKDLLRDEGEMYAKQLEARGKLIELDEFDTGHIGSLPGVSNGGPGDGAMAKAIQVLKEHLHET